MERWEHADVDLELRLLGEWKVWLGPALRGAGGVGARGRGAGRDATNEQRAGPGTARRAWGGFGFRMRRTLAVVLTRLATHRLANGQRVVCSTSGRSASGGRVVGVGVGAAACCPGRALDDKGKYPPSVLPAISTVTDGALKRWFADVNAQGIDDDCLTALRLFGTMSNSAELP